MSLITLRAAPEILDGIFRMLPRGFSGSRPEHLNIKQSADSIIYLVIGAVQFGHQGLLLIVDDFLLHFYNSHFINFDLTFLVQTGNLIVVDRIICYAVRAPALVGYYFGLCLGSLVIVILCELLGLSRHWPGILS